MARSKENRVRTTVSIDPEVLAIFRRIAESSRISVGRAIGDWCADTSEGAQFVASKMEQARKQPGLVMREMQAAAVGLLGEIRDVSRQVSESRRGGAKRHTGGDR